MRNRSCFSDAKKRESRMQNAFSPMSAISLSSVRLVSLLRRLFPPACCHVVELTTEALSPTVHNDAIFINEATDTASFRSSGIWNFLISGVSRMFDIPFPLPVPLPLSFPQLPDTHMSRTCVRSGADKDPLSLSLSCSIFHFLFFPRSLLQC